MVRTYVANGRPSPFRRPPHFRMPLSKTSSRSVNGDPLFVTSKPSGAKMAPSRDFRMAGAAGYSGLPLLSTGFHVREMGDQVIEKDGIREWRVRVRPGPQASGVERERRPPALREAAVRGIMTFPFAPGQVGPPTTMKIRCFYWLSAHWLPNVEATKCQIPRFFMRGGETSARSFGGNHVLGQVGRQFGYRRCCTRATQAAIPPTHALGEYHPLRARRLSLWKHFWPLAPRRLAAFHNSESSGALDETWNRKAASLLMFPPEPVSRSPSAVTGLHARPPAVKPAPPSPWWAARLVEFTE